MIPQPTQSYEFGPFRVDAVERVLFHQGQPVNLTAKVFDVLLLLLENSGHVVEKDRLMKEVWPDACVEEGNLTQNIFVLRKVLAMGDEEHSYIQTVPKRGYRFTGHVHEVLEGDEVVVEEHSRSRVVIEEHHLNGNETSRPAATLLPVSQERSWTTSTLVRVVLLAGVLLVGLAFLVSRFSFSSKPGAGKDSTAAANQPRSIAVLPFRSLSVNKNEEFLGLGMSEALISRLSNVAELKIRPTSSVRKYASDDRDAITIGKELQVDSVLEGSVQRDSEKIRVTVQLVEVKDGSTLWANTFDGPFTNIFSVEDVISKQVVESLTLKLSEAENLRLHKHETSNTAAYELYLQGRFHLNDFTEGGTKLARKYFEQAIAQDARYAPAYSGLAESFAFGEIGLRPEEAFPKARDAATKALELDETQGEAHAVLAQVGFLWDWNWTAADKEFKKALQINPGQPEIHHMYAHYLVAMGRFPEALSESHRLLELDPLSPASRNHLGWHYLNAHEWELAIEQYKQVLAIDPNFVEAHRQLANAYWEQGKLDDGITEMNRRFELMGRSSDAALLRQVYSESGWNGYWRKRLEIIMQRSKQAYVSPTSVSYCYLQLNDKPRALDWLERAYREHDDDLVYMKVVYTWDRLREEPRFQEVLRRMKFE